MRLLDLYHDLISAGILKGRRDGGSLWNFISTTCEEEEEEEEKGEEGGW